MIRLTERARERISEVLRPGDLAVDATAGNGHDTLFLSQAVGGQGCVIAFDIQAKAILSTRSRLLSAGADNVKLLQASHAQLEELLPIEAQGNVVAVMFNLGYLPGSDHSVATSAATTLAGMDAAVRVLRAGGLMTVIAYRGHAGGEEEAAAIESWLDRLDPSRFTVERFDGVSGRRIAPVLFVVTAAAGGSLA